MNIINSKKMSFKQKALLALAFTPLVPFIGNSINQGDIQKAYAQAKSNPAVEENTSIPASTSSISNVLNKLKAHGPGIAVLLPIILISLIKIINKHKQLNDAFIEPHLLDSIFEEIDTKELEELGNFIDQEIKSITQKQANARSVFTKIFDKIYNVFSKHEQEIDSTSVPVLKIIKKALKNVQHKNPEEIASEMEEQFNTFSYYLKKDISKIKGLSDSMPVIAAVATAISLVNGAGLDSLIYFAAIAAWAGIGIYNRPILEGKYDAIEAQCLDHLPPKFENHIIPKTRKRGRNV